MAPRRICGLSKDVTLSVLPRLHFDEVLVELRRREIDARGILVRVLKGIMVLEYQEQEEYLALGEASSKTSGTNDCTPDKTEDGDANHGDRRFSPCTSSPELGYVSMEMDTSPKPDMTSSNPDSNLAGHGDACSLGGTAQNGRLGQDEKMYLASHEKDSRIELNKGEDGSDCYGIVIASTTSTSGGYSQQGFSAEATNVDHRYLHGNAVQNEDGQRNGSHDDDLYNVTTNEQEQNNDRSSSMATDESVSNELRVPATCEYSQAIGRTVVNGFTMATDGRHDNSQVYHAGNQRPLSFFREQVKNRNIPYHNVVNMAETMAMQGERQSTPNGTIIENFGNLGIVTQNVTRYDEPRAGYHPHANGVLHPTRGEENLTQPTASFDGTDGRHCSNHDNGVLNLTTRNPFENVRIKVEPVDDRSEEFGQMDLPDGCQATPTALANQEAAPREAHRTTSPVTSQVTGNTTSSDQGKAEDESWKCPHCLYKTAYGPGVGRHLKAHSTAHWPYLCSYCPFKTDSEEYLAMHIYNSHIAQQVKCPFCSFVTESKTVMENHMLKYHWELAAFDSLSNEKSPLGIGEDENSQPCLRPTQKRLHCQHCEFTASRQVEMDMHKSLHDKPFVHVCRFCGYRTAERPNYMRHLRIHAGFRPHKCPYCTYSASMKHHLNDHLRTHTGEKPFHCRMCNYKAAFRSNLAQHMKKVHKVVDKFRCQRCSYSTICQQRMLAHTKEHERKEELKKSKKSGQPTINENGPVTSETNASDNTAPELDTYADRSTPMPQTTQDPPTNVDTDR